jgi:FkbM family methyltransferase
MLIPLESIKQMTNTPITGVIHIGAHHGQEYDDYVSVLGLSGNDMVFIEPAKEPFTILAEREYHNLPPKLINVACGEEQGEGDMHIASFDQSSSLLPPALHLVQHPDIIFNGEVEKVSIATLDSLIDSKRYNMLNIDTQGYELKVLKGARATLANIDVVYTEVNRANVYEGNPHISEITEYLQEFGFSLVHSIWCGYWGDAIYIKTNAKV